MNKNKKIVKHGELEEEKSERIADCRCRVIKHAMDILEEEGVVQLNLQSTCENVLKLDKDRAKNEARNIKNFVKAHIMTLEELSPSRKGALLFMLGEPAPEAYRAEYEKYISVDSNGFIETLMFPGEKRVDVKYNKHLHKHKKEKKEGKVSGRPRRQPQLSGSSHNRQNKKKAAAKPTSPLESSCSDTDPTSKESKKPPATRSRRSISESGTGKVDETREASTLLRSVLSESQIMDVGRPKGIPLPPDVTPSPPMMSTQSWSVEKANQDVSHLNPDQKKVDNMRTSRRPSFFLSKKVMSMELQTVMREVSMFYRTIASDSQSEFLKDIAVGTITRWHMKISPRKLLYVLDSLFLEIFEIVEAPQSCQFTNSTDVMKLLVAFPEMCKKFGYEMINSVRDDWEYLKQKDKENPMFVSTSDLDQILSYHLRRL